MVIHVFVFLRGMELAGMEGAKGPKANLPRGGVFPISSIVCDGKRKDLWLVTDYGDWLWHAELPMRQDDPILGRGRIKAGHPLGVVT